MPRSTEALIESVVLGILWLFLASTYAAAQPTLPELPGERAAVRSAPSGLLHAPSGAPSTKAKIRQMVLHGVMPGLSPKGERPAALLVLSGVGGWVVGTATGAALGYLLVDRGRASFLPEGAILGGGAGFLLGAPLGVHLANGRQGNYLLGFLASAVTGIGSAVLLVRVLDTRSAMQSTFAIGVPLTLQIGTSVVVERATAR